jgi:AcrR family transcriptional regulator
MRSLPTPAISRRTEILDKAANVFAALGVRASLKDIADSCNILPGSIYFHFESKDALIVNLVQRYFDDLNQVAQQARDSLNNSLEEDVAERVRAFCGEIARAAAHHPAALLMTLFEPPTGASAELRRLVLDSPTAIHGTMNELLRSGDMVCRSIDTVRLSDRLCESMLRHGLLENPSGRQTARVSKLRCSILLEGLASEQPSDSELDSSQALQSVKRIVAGWEEEVVGDERRANLLRAARTKFAQHGYAFATAREIAAAAELSTGTAYRLFPSKASMLTAILADYGKRRKESCDAIMQSGSTPLQKLDALMWLYLHLLRRFSDEITIQFSLIREAPRDGRRIGRLPSFRDIERLLENGVKMGEIRPYAGPITEYARCVREALWAPKSVLEAIGIEGAHDLARASVLRGALERS